MSLKFNVHFASGNGNHRVLRKGKVPKHSKSTRLPRITRLMALAIKYERLLQKGLVKSHREIAELAGADRSHISRILKLRLLAPDIQEWIINLPEQDKDPFEWSAIEPVTRITSWEEQRKEFKHLLPQQ